MGEVSTAAEIVVRVKLYSGSPGLFRGCSLFYATLSSCHPVLVSAGLGLFFVRFCGFFCGGCVFVLW